MYLFIFEWVHGFLFYSMCYDSILSLFILMLNLSRFGQWDPLQFGSYILLTCSYYFWELPYALAQDVLGLSVLFLFQPQTQSLLQCHLVTFSGKWYLKTKIWGLGVLFALGLLLLGLLNRDLENRCAYIHTYIQLFLYFSTHIY